MHWILTFAKVVLPLSSGPPDTVVRQMTNPALSRPTACTNLHIECDRCYSHAIKPNKKAENIKLTKLLQKKTA